MKTKTHVRAGGITLNHNETLVRDVPKATGLRVKTKVKAGALTNHNETLVQDSSRAKARKLETRVKASRCGPFFLPEGEWRTRHMHVRLALASAILVLAALLGSFGPVQAAAPVYYVSLGTSLAEGAGAENGQGYADQLATTLGLQLVKLGCGGQTTPIMLEGGGCPYPHGSQVKEAEAFLRANQGAVALVTIDAGADDILADCPTLFFGNPPPDARCINDTFTTIEANLPTILQKLRLAAGPTVPIIGMTYYDLFLGFWVQGEDGQALALDTYGMFLRFNDTLEGIYKAARSPVADVEGAFSTTNFKMVTTPEFGSIPFNVARICQWTHMCESPPDIHANTEGHGVIAEAFRKVLR
jgi:lysophospholipase L1-like esterase